MPTFAALFGRPARVRADAPGRVNLIGEHTDYSGGFVLPIATPQRTRVELTARADRRVRCWSAELSGNDPPLEYELGAEAARGTWLDYVQGVTAALGASGHSLGGFELRVESDLPLGGGLASSAALELSVLRALRLAFDLALGDLELALLGQRAEHDLVGARVGIMDQVAASLGDSSSALFLDTRSLHFEKLPLPAEAELAVISSGVAHQHASGEYNRRRQQCEQAAALLGVDQLRALGRADLPRVAALPAPLDRRARHVLTENARVLAAVEAIRQADLPRLGALLDASHESLRVDFEVSAAELDVLVELARAEPAVFGARLTGGGFGGSVVILARAGAARAAADRVAAAYQARSGRQPSVLLPPG